MDDLEKELKICFLEEAGQLIEETEQAFLDLEFNQNDPDILNQIFRLAHNIKGTSRAVGFNDVADFTHHFESLLLRIQEGRIELTSEIITLLLKCNDHLSIVISELQENMDAKIHSVSLITEIEYAIENKNSESKASDIVESEDHLQEDEDVIEKEFISLEEIKKLKVPEPLSSDDIESLIEDSLSQEKVDLFAEANSESSDDDDFSVDAIKKLENFDGDVMKSESSPESNLNLQDLNFESGAGDSSGEPPRRGDSSGGSGRKPSSNKRIVDETLRVKLKEIEKLNNYVGELVILQTVLNQQKHEFQSELIQKTVGQLEKLSKEIQSISMGMRMIPIRQTFQKMQRTVRDLSDTLGKRVNLEIHGEETEVDKTVIEKLADPLVHIIRNAVDHGLEDPEKRARLGKDIYGKLKLTAFHEGNNLVIEVEDDGSGIDISAIKEKAINKGIISGKRKMSDSELLNLIFHPGFSTKTEVSEISGRGVGMDVVKNNIEKLSGKVMIDTIKGEGSKFKVVLPLTLAIIDSMITEVGGMKYVFPITQITETLQPKPEMISNVTGAGCLLTLRGQVMPIYRLGKRLNAKTFIENPAEGIVVIVNGYGNTFAVLVDEIIRLQQVVIKKMGDEIQQKKGMIGSAILGDGLPSIIVDLNEMFAVEASSNKKLAQITTGVA